MPVRPVTPALLSAAAAARRAAGQPFYAMTRVAQAIPSPVRRPLARAVLAATPASGARAALRMIALDLLGRRPEAIALAEERATTGTTPGVRLALARAALALKAPATAERLVRGMEAAHVDRPGALVLRADVAFRNGQFSDALRLVRRARAAGARGPAIDQIERRTASELRVLQPGWRPSLPRGGGPLRSTTRGRVLHLVTNSLPHREAGYTVRSQSIGRVQLDVGLDPHFATQAGFPRTVGVVRAPREEQVDGVTYHRLDPDFDRFTGPVATITRTAHEAIGLIERLRPAVLHPATNFHNAQAALALGQRFGLPVVYEVRGFLEETWASRQGGDPESRASDADRYQGAKAAETACMLAADAIVTLSETMRVDIVGRGVAPDRVSVIP
ncbi:MAG TPA: glycosyltransferase, partial [Vitreimonas sp.]|nr:glycosyltransferase [Vitreimonas sp.]